MRRFYAHRPRLMPETSAAPPLTYEDYCLIPDDGKRHEIIDGEEYMSPSPTTSHQRVVLKLLYSLQQYLEENEVGEVFAVPHDVLLSDHDIVQPDVFFVADGCRDIVKERGIEGGRTSSRRSCRRATGGTTRSASGSCTPGTASPSTGSSTRPSTP